MCIAFRFTLFPGSSRTPWISGRWGARYWRWPPANPRGTSWRASNPGFDCILKATRYWPWRGPSCRSFRKNRWEKMGMEPDRVLERGWFPCLFGTLLQHAFDCGWNPNKTSRSTWDNSVNDNVPSVAMFECFSS